MNTLQEQLNEYVRLNEYVNEPTIEMVFGNISGYATVNKENMTKILTIFAENKVRKFVLAEASSDLMNELEAFTEAGCRMVGMKKLRYTDQWGDTREIKGVELAF